MKKLWLKIKGFFIVIFGGAKKFEQFMRDHADDAVAIVEKIKWFVDNPVIIMLIDIFPGKYGTKAKPILDQIENVLNEVLSGMAIGQACLALPTFLERFKCAVENIRKIEDSDDRDNIYNAIAVNYVRARSREFTGDQEPIAKSTARTIVEMKLQEIKADKAGVKPANVA